MHFLVGIVLGSTFYVLLDSFVTRGFRLEKPDLRACMNGSVRLEAYHIWNEGIALTLLFCYSYHIDKLAPRSDLLLTSRCSIAKFFWAQALRLTYGYRFCNTEWNFYWAAKSEPRFQLCWILSGNLLVCYFWKFRGCSLPVESGYILLISTSLLLLCC